MMPVDEEKLKSDINTLESYLKTIRRVLKGAHDKTEAAQLQLASEL